MSIRNQNSGNRSKLLFRVPTCGVKRGLYSVHITFLIFYFLFIYRKNNITSTELVPVTFSLGY